MRHYYTHLESIVQPSTKEGLSSSMRQKLYPLGVKPVFKAPGSPGIPEHILKESDYDDDDDFDGANEKLYRDTNLKKSDASPITNVKKLSSGPTLNKYRLYICVLTFTRSFITNVNSTLTNVVKLAGFLLDDNHRVLYRMAMMILTSSCLELKPIWSFSFSSQFGFLSFS